MSKVGEQEVSSTKSPRAGREGTGRSRRTPVTLPKQLLSSTRIVQLLPERTRMRKGSVALPECKKGDSVEVTFPRGETPMTPLPLEPVTPVIANNDEIMTRSEETPTIPFEGRPKRNTPRLHRFIDDFFFPMKALMVPKSSSRNRPSRSSLPPILDENGIPIKRKRGRPSNRERLEIQLQASQRMKAQDSAGSGDRPTEASQECLARPTGPVLESGKGSTPKLKDGMPQRPALGEGTGQSMAPRSESTIKKSKDTLSQKHGKKVKARGEVKKKHKPEKDTLQSMEKENTSEQQQQPIKKKRGRPRKHFPLREETPAAPEGRSRSLSALPRTPSSRQRDGKGAHKRKSLPSVRKHHKVVTIADLITESESAGESDQEDALITSEDEQRDATFRASNVKISPLSKAYHPVLNPLPGFIDAITCTEVIRPAISPYGHVLSWETWIKVLCFGDPKNVCPFTKRRLTRHQLRVLDFDNIEEFRARIQNI